jgi:tetratricopeptide (TPR) repeat protein
LETFVLVGTALLMIPYIGWGIYMLSQRYRYHEEAGPLTEAITLLCVVMFMTLQIVLLNTWLSKNPLVFVFTLLGLIVSMAALYGHMAISFTSRLIVEAVTTSDEGVANAPRLGPVEALERERDHEGALQECLILARIYPREPSVHLHAAENLLQLDRPEEAVDALERALKYVDAPEKNLLVMNRLCEVFLHDLGDPGRAVAVMQRYLKRYPATPYAQSLEQRMATAFDSREVHIPEQLASLDKTPMEEIVEPEDVPRAPSPFRLESMEETIVPEEEIEGEAEAVSALSENSRRRTAPSVLSALDDNPLSDELEEESRAGAGVPGGLQALDTALLEEDEEETPEEHTTGMQWQLEAMEEDEQ